MPWPDSEAEELTRCCYEKGFFPRLEEEEAETCGRIHEFENRQSVAVTIEHAYDDWCVAQLAAWLGRGGCLTSWTALILLLNRNL